MRPFLRQIIKTIARCVGFASLLAMVGCIPHALEPRFVVYEQTADTRIASLGEPVFLLGSKQFETALTLSQREFIGHQFVLGAIPVTRLYYPGNAEQAALDVVMNQVLLQGFSPMYVSVAAQEICIRNAKDGPQQFGILSAEMKADAFDFLFIRKAVVEGKIAFFGAARTPGGIFPLHFVDSKWAWTAHTPLLSHMWGGKLRENMNYVFDPTHIRAGRSTEAFCAAVPMPWVFYETGKLLWEGELEPRSNYLAKTAVSNELIKQKIPFVASPARRAWRGIVASDTPVFLSHRYQHDMLLLTLESEERKPIRVALCRPLNEQTTVENLTRSAVSLLFNIELQNAPIDVSCSLTE